MLTSRVAIANNNYLFSTTFPGLSIYELFVCTKSLLRFMEIRSHLAYLCIYYVYALYTVLTTFIRKVYKHNATYMYFNCKYTCRLIFSSVVRCNNKSKLTFIYRYNINIGCPNIDNTNEVGVILLQILSGNLCQCTV